MSTSLRAAARVATLVLAIGFLAGCSAENSYNEEGDQAPRSDLDDTRPSAWENAEVVDETHIRVEFFGGVDDCYGHDVDFEETASTITISLYAGRLPRNYEGCNALAVKYTTLVETQQPIGDREIIYGNTE